MKIVGTAVVGLAFLIAGFLYDLMFARIPHQDTTPELWAAWKFHADMAFIILTVGALIFCIGLLLIPFVAKWTATPPES
ncbi:MAG: hypothetical protein AAF557_01445 [Pseudomonadota bacterium]